MSRHVSRVGVVSVLLLLLSLPAFAQSEHRGYVQALGGVTFGTETAGVFGGGFGVNVHSNVQLTGEFGYMQNILSKYVQDIADDAARAVEDFYLYFLGEQISVDFDAKAPSFYGTGGVRLLTTPSSRARAFLDAAVGFASLSPEVRLRIDGEDLTQDLINEGLFSRPDDVSKLLMAFGGGMTVTVGKGLALDVGYRYSRIFAEEAINVSRAYAAVGYAF